MPIYEYRCGACGHELEAVQPMGAEAPGACPECGGDLRRRWSRVGVRFSGWGFSSTDALAPQGRKGRKPKDFKALKRKAEEIADS